MKINLSKENIQTDSVVDGPGLRAVLWTQGCSHNCKGCHNPETHNFNKKYEIDVEAVKEEISALKYHDGITLTGGDPMFQPREILEIIKHANEMDLNIWLYTGYTVEQILKMPKIYQEILKNIDVLVDGKFELKERSFDCLYRGSKNQRIIDAKKSFKAKKAIPITKYNKTSNGLLYTKKENVFI